MTWQTLSSCLRYLSFFGGMVSESVAWSVVTQVGKYRQTDLTVSGRAQKLCESRGGCPGLPVPNSPYGFCERKATRH